MSDCNFTYISEEYLVDKFLENDDGGFKKIFEKDYPHIWVPDYSNSGKIPETISWVFDEDLIKFHNQSRYFHNMYASLLETNIKEKNNNDLIWKYINSENIESEKFKFIKNKNIFKHDKQDLELYFSDNSEFTDVDRTYHCDCALYSQLFAFLISILKVFILYLLENNIKKYKDFIKTYAKDKRPDYIIYGKYIDDICGMRELEQLFFQTQYESFNRIRNMSMHDLSETLSKRSTEVTICECFYMIKQLLDLLTTNDKIESRLLKIHPKSEFIPWRSKNPKNQK